MSAKFTIDSSPLSGNEVSGSLRELEGFRLVMFFDPRQSLSSPYPEFADEDSRVRVSEISLEFS